MQTFQAIAAFPQRPLAVRPPATSRPVLAALLGFLFFSAIAAAAGWFFGTGLLADWQIQRAGPVPARDARLISGRCTAKAFIHWCDGTLAASAKDGGAQTAIHYLFADFHTGSRTLDILRDPANPSRLTTDLGQETLTNRSITLGIIMGGSALLALGSLLRLRGGRAAKGVASMDGAVLHPVPVRITGARQDGKSMRWAVEWFENGRRKAEWPVPKGVEPFLLRPDGWVLGVRARPGQTPLPLDADLSWVGLSDDERARIHQARTMDWQAA